MMPSMIVRTEVLGQPARQLQLRPQPGQAVVWFPHWNSRRPVPVSDGAHLGGLIGQVSQGDYGGVELERTRGGPWAQVKCLGKGRFLVELHPHVYHGPDDGMYFERVNGVSAVTAGALCWAWVRREPLPADIALEPRVVPPGGIRDVPL